MIKKCSKCNSYTLRKEHCGKETEKARPPKFSFPDRYGKYRRQTKKEV
ncbi:MAG: nucleolar RNA-binding Nop10p family protein [Candidatus Nanohaloarchaea archaeon]